MPQHVLRFWESRFREIKPLKRGGGRRYYRPEDIGLLRGIHHLLYGEGYTIRGVQRILRDQGVQFVQTVWQPGAPRPVHAAEADDVADTADEIEITDVETPDDSSSRAFRDRARRVGPRLAPSIIDREQGAPASRGPHIPPRRLRRQRSRHRLRRRAALRPRAVQKLTIGAARTRRVPQAARCGRGSG